MVRWDIFNMLLRLMIERENPVANRDAKGRLKELSSRAAAPFIAANAKDRSTMVMYRRSKALGIVMHSTNAPDDWLCVDFFQRPDHSYGFEEYRRDCETAEGWFPIGFHSGKIFETLAAARQDAIDSVAWLEK